MRYLFSLFFRIVKIHILAYNRTKLILFDYIERVKEQVKIDILTGLIRVKILRERIKMKQILVKDILKICDAELVCGDENIACESFSKDTRQIQEGDIYVGINGGNFNGSNFYQDAFSKGAAACIIEEIETKEIDKVTYADKAIIKVKDTIKALQQIATYKRSLYQIPVIAITGSVGKTSTKDVVAGVVAKKYKVLKTQGNLNNHIGVPLTILNLRDHEALVVEMGMSGLGEIRTLTNIAKPDIAIITNIGTSHIGDLGSRENILKAKLEIIEGLKENGTLIINNDNDLLHKWYEQNKEKTKSYQIETFGIYQESHQMAQDRVLGEDASKYEVNMKGKTYPIYVPAPGEPFIYNSLCAITVGMLLNMQMEDIAEGIKYFELTKNRMDIYVNKQNVTIIDGTYNASYDALKPAIQYLAQKSGNQKIAMLGNILDLGPYEQSLHEAVGEELVHNHIDVLVTVGDNMQYTINKVIALGMKKEQIYPCQNNEEAVAVLKKIMKPKDVVLVKASHAMHFTEIVEKIK